MSWCCLSAIPFVRGSRHFHDLFPFPDWESFQQSFPQRDSYPFAPLSSLYRPRHESRSIRTARAALSTLSSRKPSFPSLCPCPLTCASPTVSSPRKDPPAPHPQRTLRFGRCVFSLSGSSAPPGIFSAFLRTGERIRDSEAFASALRPLPRSAPPGVWPCGRVRDAFLCLISRVSSFIPGGSAALPGLG